MSKIDEIRQGLKLLCAGPVQTVIATVLQVDSGLLSMTCEPAGGGAPYEDVRLKASIGEDKSGIYVLPKVGSSVLLGIINDDEDSTFLLTAESVDKVIIKVGSSEVELEDELIKMNGGSLGGLIKIEPLMEYFDKIFQFCNAIKSVVDVSTYPTASTGSPDVFHQALKAAIDPHGAPYVTQTQIEDTAITH